MSTDLNPDSSPVAPSEESPNEQIIVGVLKCVAIGTGVGVAGITICFVLLLPVLLSIRELGLLILLVLIPVAAFWIRSVGKRYLRHHTNRLGGAIAFGLQYLVVGAGIGLFLKLFVVGGGIADTPFVVFVGSVIGTMIGSLGGAFQGWIQVRRKPVAPGK